MSYTKQLLPSKRQKCTWKHINNFLFLPYCPYNGAVYILKIPCHQSFMLFTNTFKFTLPLECLNYHTLLTLTLPSNITAVIEDRIQRMKVSVHAYLTHTLWSQKQHCENCKFQKYSNMQIFKKNASSCKPLTLNNLCWLSKQGYNRYNCYIIILVIKIIFNMHASSL